MTAQEKLSIYALLKATSTYLSGYIPSAYKEEPSFEDDTIEESFIDTKKEESTIESVSKRIQDCSLCALCKTRINTVPGEGVLKPYVLVVGEGPGEEEDKSGRPFVGKAGQLLDKMLSAISLSRTSNCFIANIVKCRPPQNRTPLKDEAIACSIYLNEQISILKPKFILAMGRCAAQNLLHTDSGINALRGKILDCNGIPLLATYHPSALLRDESLKRPAWNDLKVAKAKLLELCPDYATELI